MECNVARVLTAFPDYLEQKPSPMVDSYATVHVAGLRSNSRRHPDWCKSANGARC